MIVQALFLIGTVLSLVGVTGFGIGMFLGHECRLAAKGTTYHYMLETRHKWTMISATIVSLVGVAFVDVSFHLSKLAYPTSWVFKFHLFAVALLLVTGGRAFILNGRKNPIVHRKIARVFGVLAAAVFLTSIPEYVREAAWIF